MKKYKLWRIVPWMILLLVIALFCLIPNDKSVIVVVGLAALAVLAAIFFVGAIVTKVGLEATERINHDIK